MTLIFAILEGSLILAAAVSALLIWAPPMTGSWWALLTLLAGAGGLTLSCLLAFFYAGLYDLRVSRDFEVFLGLLPRALAAAIFLAVLTSMAVPAARIANDAFVSSVLFPVAVVFGPVVPLRAIAYRLLRSRRFVQRLLIVGAGPLSWRLVHEIEAQLDYRYAVAAIADDTPDPADAPLVIGPLDRLDEIVSDIRPHRIVLALADWRGRLPVRELLKARIYRGIPIEDIVEVYERITGKLAIEALTPSHLIFSEGFCQSRLTQVVRRGVSVVVAAVGLVVAAPLLALIALAIRAEAPGPVLFTQRRLGLYGKAFVLLKFRTMRATKTPTSEWERDNRDRVTRVGKWLRLLWLDELPQLVNILRGDMDLVGPRPHPVSNGPLFTDNVPYYALRMSVRPGITGWAQIRYGYANGLDEETEKIRYDLYYIKHRSLWLDLRILFGTLKWMLGGRARAASDAQEVEAPRAGPVPWQPPAWHPLDGDGVVRVEARFAAGDLDPQLTHKPIPQ